MRARRLLRKNRAGIPETPKNNGIFLVLRHPLTTLCVGFLFTIIIGGAISRHYDADATKRRLIDSRISESAKFTESAASYLARATLLTDAIRKRESDQQILSKKTLYEESKVEWIKNTFLLESISSRTTTGINNSEFLAMRVQYTVNNALEAMDNCLQPALSEINISDKNSALDTCPKHAYGGERWRNAQHKIEDRIKIAGRCISETHNLFESFATFTEDLTGLNAMYILSCRPALPEELKRAKNMERFFELIMDK